MNANGRRCRQLKNGNRHVARLGRSIYRATSSTLSTAESIQRERVKAARMAAAKSKKKQK